MAFDLVSRRQSGRDWSCEIGEGDASAGALDQPITGKSVIVIAAAYILGTLTRPVLAVLKKKLERPKLFDQHNRRIK